MAFADSNDAKMKFVGWAVFAKFGLISPQNCIFIPYGLAEPEGGYRFTRCPSVRPCVRP